MLQKLRRTLHGAAFPYFMVLAVCIGFNATMEVSFIVTFTVFVVRSSFFSGSVSGMGVGSLFLKAFLSLTVCLSMLITVKASGIFFHAGSGFIFSEVFCGAFAYGLVALFVVCIILCFFASCVYCLICFFVYCFVVFSGGRTLIGFSTFLAVVIVACLIISIFLSVEKCPFLSILIPMAITTSSNIVSALFRILRCPAVNGSNEPGKSALRFIWYGL